MAISAVQVATTDTLETLRQEYNNLRTDVNGIDTGILNLTTWIFEGATADAYETTIAVVDPTADRTITFPNLTGTVALTGTNITIPNAGTIGSASDTDAISISSGGVVNFTQRPTFAASLTVQNDGQIGSTGDTDAIAISSAGVVSMSQSTIFAKGADVASATALVLLTDGNYFDVTGTTTITSFNTMGGNGSKAPHIKLHFDGIVTLTHHAADLILAGAENFTTEAGDELEFVEYAAGDWRMTGWSLAGTAPGGGGGGAFLGEGVAGASVGDSGDIIRVSQQTLDTSQTMAATDNGSTAGPLTVASGVTLTISAGATFVVI